MITLLAETAAQFLALGRVDWYDTRAGVYLHWAELGPEHHDSIAGGWSVTGPVRLACGRTAAMLVIPGMSSRLASMRCTGCCKATGMVPGIGSPKNDNDCRALLGLPPLGEEQPG